MVVESTPRLEGLLKAEAEAPLLATPLRLPVLSPWTGGCEGKGEPPDDGRCAGLGQSHLDLSATGTHGQVLDLVHSQGELYRVTETTAGRGYDVLTQWEPRFALADVVLGPPALEELRRRWSDIDLALLAQMARGTRPSILHGSAFLQLRSRLGQALMVRDDYRKWARQRLYEAAKREIHAMWSDVDPAEWKMIAPLLDLRAHRIRPSAPQRVLAEWLGDIRAFKLAEKIQGRVINAVLIVPETGDPMAWRARARQMMGLVQEQWSEWAQWFPIATDRQIVVPLIPVYDPGKDVVGYYRVILPGPGIHHSRRRPPPHRWPDEPQALMLVEDLTGRPPIAEAFVGRMLVRRIGWMDYSEGQAHRLYLEWMAQKASSDDSSRAFGLIERTRYVVEIIFSPNGGRGVEGSGRSGGDGDGMLRLRAFYDDNRGTNPPLCVELADSSLRGPLPPWSVPLQRALETEGLLCPSHVPVELN